MCKVCDALARYKRSAEIWKEYDPDASYRFSVALVRRKFIKGRRGCQDTVTDYRYQGCGYALNFCPECGRDLRKKG